MDSIVWLVLIMCLFALAYQLISPTAKFSNDSCLGLKVDLILKHLGIDATQAVNEKIKELVKAGQKIQAIKLYRDYSGVGLKVAKDYVESLVSIQLQ